MQGERGRTSPWLGSVFVWLAAMLLLAGCATQTQSLLMRGVPDLPRRAELSSTPFHPQERYQCGPAALAMSLNAAGIAVGPEALVSQVFVPAREGSLQPEMLAAARRNGAVGVVIPPRLDALAAEIAAGNPVIVLQNLSLPLFPLWHYAVAIGYDLDAETIVLRSGITERLEMPLSTFENTWARSGYWGMVAAPPGRIPVTPGEAAIVDSLVAFERTAGSAKVRGAYQAALKRWPDNLTLQVGFGNAAFAAGDLKTAESVFRRAADAHPKNAAVLNNLATVLADMGELDRAADIAARAVALGGPWQEEAEATLRSIRSARKAGVGR
ncbi:PA2778 family cysteine peptidase [Noviherbaspirillum sp.]|uniref:PA2778 family cysteine peptidase n=1 Tax=Noviherbaspirillum sp. TaxID=1926288 RepID=UPI002D3D0C10|nr:PA2778 family cysteine peptidase [Noviherbaspirillum sp.]HZW21492.1 PA2778 family cysteine peptidase [Noviherbaspirillum sp.]